MRNGSLYFSPTTPFAQFMLLTRLDRKLARKTVAIDARMGYVTLLGHERGDNIPSAAKFARWARIMRLTDGELKRALFLLSTSQDDGAAEPAPLLELMRCGQMRSATASSSS